MIRINDLQSNKKYRERETRAAKMVRDFIALIAASEKPVAVGRDILAAAPTLKREISAASA